MNQNEGRPPENTNRPSRMQLVGENQTPDSLPHLMSQMTGSKTPTPSPSPPVPPEFIHRAAWKAGVLGALNVLSALLAVRLTLLLACAGAFVLCFLTIQTANLAQAMIVLIYTVVVVVPLIALAAYR